MINKADQFSASKAQTSKHSLELYQNQNQHTPQRIIILTNLQINHLISNILNTNPLINIYIQPNSIFAVSKNHSQLPTIIIKIILLMFFGFGLPLFQQPQPQPNQGGGFLDFLANFMNPRAQQPQQPEPQNPQARPVYRRSSGSETEQKQQNSPKASKVIHPPTSGMYWKQKGNESYNKKDYYTAIQHYTKALSLSEDSVFYTNRARCYKIIKQYERAIKDCQNAIELDQKNIKANLIAGQCLAELGKKDQTNLKIETAITRLKKALVLSSSEKNSSYVREINVYIYRAKKLLWYKKFIALRDARIRAIKQYKEYVQKDQTLDSEKAELKVKQFMNSTNQPIKMQIPDYFICKITFDIMEDPVITDSGQTYERSAIQENIQRNGKTDPFTRAPITGNLYPNFGLKRAIQDFIDNNPWAYEFREQQDYNEIQF